MLLVIWAAARYRYADIYSELNYSCNYSVTTASTPGGIDETLGDPLASTFSPLHLYRMVTKHLGHMSSCHCPAVFGALYQDKCLAEKDSKVPSLQLFLVPISLLFYNSFIWKI